MAVTETEAKEVNTEAKGSTDETKVVIPTPEGTVDDTQKVQPGETNDDPDPIELWKESFLKTQIESLKAEAKEQARREYEAQQIAAQQRQAAEQAAAEMNNSFTDAARKVAATLKAVKDDEGNPLSDSFIQQIIEPWQGHNAKVQGLTTRNIWSGIAQTIYESLPAQAREEFSARAANKPVKEYLQIYAELMAPETSHAKKLTEDKTLAEQAAEARGFAKGQRNPKGTPKQGNERGAVVPGEVDLTTIRGISRAKADGKITDEKFLQLFDELQRG